MNRTDFYISLIPKIRAVGWKNGYAIAIHGSLKRDLDILAIPWTMKVSNTNLLVNEIAIICGGALKKEKIQKPHGRVAYNIIFPQHRDILNYPLWSVPFIDISIVPEIVGD